MEHIKKIFFKLNDLRGDLLHRFSYSLDFNVHYSEIVQTMQKLELYLLNEYTALSTATNQFNNYNDSYDQSASHHATKNPNLPIHTAYPTANQHV